MCNIFSIHRWSWDCFILTFGVIIIIVIVITFLIVVFVGIIFMPVFAVFEAVVILEMGQGLNLGLEAQALESFDLFLERVGVSEMFLDVLAPVTALLLCWGCDGMGDKTSC